MNALLLSCMLAAVMSAEPQSLKLPNSAMSNKEPKTEKVSKVNSSDLSTAPLPHKPGEAKPLSPTQLWKDRPSKKPWSELIVGKWVYAGHDILGRKVWEFTKDGKLKTCYSYPAASNGNHPAGVERSTEDYRVNGKVLFPTSYFDNQARIIESTTFIESLTENELRIYAIKRVRRSLQTARAEAQGGKKTLQQALAEVLSEERTPTTIYVRLKDK